MLRYLTAGESHGKALVVVVEGLPAGLAVTVEDIEAELARRGLGARCVRDGASQHVIRGEELDRPGQRPASTLLIKFVSLELLDQEVTAVLKLRSDPDQPRSTEHQQAGQQQAGEE